MSKSMAQTLVSSMVDFFGKFRPTATAVMNLKEWLERTVTVEGKLNPILHKLTQAWEAGWTDYKKKLLAMEDYETLHKLNSTQVKIKERRAQPTAPAVETPAPAVETAPVAQPVTETASASAENTSNETGKASADDILQMIRNRQS